MNDSEVTHTSIRIALARRRCGEVRDVIEVLSVLEDVYNHLYAWHELACAADGGAKRAHELRSMPEIADASDMVPADRRLCLARVEVEPPAFIEVVGARYPLDVIYKYLRQCGNKNGHKKGRAIERIEAVRGEIDHLCESTLPENEIQEAVALHVIGPFKRLERLEGIEIYDNDESGKASAPRRSRSDRSAVASSPLAREH